MITRWTYAPGPKAPDKCGQMRPAVVYDGKGNPVLGVTDHWLPGYGWYPERQREALPPYTCAWLPMTVIDMAAREAYYVPDIPDEWERAALALGALHARIAAEGRHRVVIASIGFDPGVDEIGAGDDVRGLQIERSAQAQVMEYRAQIGISTAGEDGTLAMLADIPADIATIKQTTQTIIEWTTAHIETVEEADAFDPAHLPKEYPQWPQF